MLLSGTLMRWFIDHYLNGTADVDDWRASPLRVEGHQGPAAGLRDDRRRRSAARRRRRIQDRLKAAGVDVTYVDYPGQFHGFWTMGKLVPEANKLTSEIAAWLKARVYSAHGAHCGRALMVRCAAKRASRRTQAAALPHPSRRASRAPQDAFSLRSPLMTRSPPSPHPRRPSQRLRRVAEGAHEGAAHAFGVAEA